MRKICISFLILTIIVLTGVALSLSKTQTHTEYLRIHIRADSNEQDAQDVKYVVKDAVVEFLTPKLVECTTKEKAEQIINDNLENIESIANSVLKRNGFSYECNAKIATEQFPTRVYGPLTLESGFYDALILELGSGSGDNWWCVVYPPLCFTTSGTNYVYRSKIMDIINDFMKNKEEK